jgi:hypothetical protein
MDVSGQLHVPKALSPGKEPAGTHSTGGRVGPRVGLDAVEKTKIPVPARNRIPADQPVA